MPENGRHATSLFNCVYKAYKDNWAASVQSSEEGLAERRYSDAFTAASRIVVVFPQNGIVSTYAAYHLDLLNDPVLGPPGADWIKQHLAEEGQRTLYYGNHLSADLGHPYIGNKGLFGRLYVTMMLRSFIDSGYDLASCHLRRKTGIDGHGDFVGLRKERIIRPLGLQKDDVLDVPTTTRTMGRSFPFEALGRPFAKMWEERCTTWTDLDRTLTKTP